MHRIDKSQLDPTDQLSYRLFEYQLRDAIAGDAFADSTQDLITQLWGPQLAGTDFKDELRALIASAYASNRDLERARARLALLGDANPLAALNAQAQQMLAAGKPFEDVQQVAQLAADLQQQASAAAPQPTRPPRRSPQ